MDKKLKTKWTNALRSGKYEQTTGRLHDGGRGYCCLGVLHLISTGQKPRQLWGNDKPVCVKQLGKRVELELAMVNDDGVPFEMIAGLIHEAL